MKPKTSTLLITALLVFLSACRTPEIPASPTAATNTQPPTATTTSTSSPTSTITPTPTDTPTPKPTATATLTPTPMGGGKMWLALMGRDENYAPYIYVGDLRTGDFNKVLKLEEPKGDKILDITSISWSPDGKQMVFGQYDGTKSDIMLLDLPSGELRKLGQTDKNRIIESIKWAPGGNRWISYMTQRFGGGYSLASLWVMDLKNPLPVNLYSDNRYSGQQYGWNDGDNRLYFTQNGDRFYSYDPTQREKTEIRRVNMDNFELNLETGSEKISGYSWGWYMPKLGAFVVESSVNKPTGRLDYERYFLLPADKSPGKLIFSGPKGDDIWFSNIEVAPNEEWIYFGGDKIGFLAGLPLSSQKKIFNQRAWFLGWSPDDRSIAFVSSTAPRLQISTFDLVKGLKTGVFSLPDNFIPAATEKTYFDTDPLGLGLYWRMNGEDLQIAGLPNEAQDPTPTLPPEPDPMENVASILQSPAIVDTEGPDKVVSNAWHAFHKDVVEQGWVKISGDPSDTAVRRVQGLYPGEAILLRIKFPLPNNIMIGLRQGNWDSSKHRYFAFRLFDNNISALHLDGGRDEGVNSLRGKINISPKGIYYLLFSIDKNGQMISAIWDAYDPTIYAESRWQPGPTNSDSRWEFVMEMFGGEVLLNRADIIRFGD